ncbi:MAG TPA: hypothetical protein VFJ94_01820 [Intrasporangium sp.]|uniref:hypothetical protein n=1 Tax=Intrasporangium sp. TaxID=1925024 RepID=UPI002D784687|nr:hypothetical protein [Intrasporangium sp.]HET7397232.1 hypothetical protein [Intrasporangium sp.]
MIRRHRAQALLAGLVLLVACLVWAYAARPGFRVPPTSPPAPADSLVVVGLPGLAWSDASAAATPSLWGLLRAGATATVSVKAINLTTCPADGWATLSAGEAAGPDASGGRPTCRALPGVAADPSGGYRVEGYAALAATTRTGPHSARLGLLGDGLATGPGCVQAIGPGAALAVARSDGRLARYTPLDAASLTRDLGACRVSVVDVGGPDDGGAASPASVRALDERVGRVVAAAPTTADIVVVGLADRDRQERLHVLAASGPHFRAGLLASASTRRVGLAQLSDVTATVLAARGVAPVEAIGGRALAVEASGGRDDASATARRTVLTDVEAKADAMHRLVAPFLLLWLGSAALVLAVLAALRGRGSAGPTGRTGRTGRGARRADRLLGWVGLVTATMPAATFLANLVPWWRGADSTTVLLGRLVPLVLAVSAGLALACRLGPWRSARLGLLAAASAVTAGVIGVDLLTGSALQLSSVFGLQPLVGGRYYGIGNVAFALFGSAVLLLCAGIGDALVSRGERGLAVLVVVVLGAAALAVDVLPAWGADLGGPVALVPALGLLLLRTAGLRPSWRAVAAVGAVVVAVLVAVAYLDWRRPAVERTHAGRFLQTVLDGGAAAVVSRKLEQNVGLLVALPALLIVGTAVVVALVAVVARPGTLGTAAFAGLVARAPLLREGLLAVVTLALVGFLTNDSGAAIPPVAALFTLPLVLAELARRPLAV